MKKEYASLEQLITEMKEEKAEIERRIVALETAPKCVEKELYTSTSKLVVAKSIPSVKTKNGLF